MKYKLISCIACEGDNIKAAKFHHEEKILWHVVCQDCLTSGPADRSIKKAVKLWNRLYVEASKKREMTDPYWLDSEYCQFMQGIQNEIL